MSGPDRSDSGLSSSSDSGLTSATNVLPVLSSFVDDGPRADTPEVRSQFPLRCKINQINRVKFPQGAKNMREPIKIGHILVFKNSGLILITFSMKCE